MSKFSRICVQWMSQHPEGLIFCACLLVYLSNGQTLASGDSVPNSLLALNWVLNGHLDFENFRNGYLFVGEKYPYYFADSIQGKLTSIYPVGPAIVSFPFYFLVAIALKLFAGSGLDITNPAFEGQRLLLEKLAATLIAAFSVVLFYCLTRLRFSPAIALITTFIYAFATQTWVISSQALWQHGSTNLLLLGILLCLFKTNRSAAAPRPLLLLNAGILSGFLMGVRPTNLVFWIAIALYCLLTYRRNVLWFAIGCCSIGLTLGWNLYHFGSIAGGYWGWTTQNFIPPAAIFMERLLGLLISPSRGFLVYMPIMVLAIAGIPPLFRARSDNSERLVIALLFSSGAVVLQYGFFGMWWAGHCYGPRFLTDLAPVFCFCMNYGIADQLWRRAAIVKAGLMGGLIAFSVFVQTVGAFGATAWEGIPLNIDRHTAQIPTQWRLWDVRDTQIERHLRSLLTRLHPPNRQPDYLQTLSGRILKIRDGQKRPIGSAIAGPARSRRLLKVRVQNTGRAPWWGYQTAAALKGEVRVRVQWIDAATSQVVSEQRLYVSGRPRPQESTTALGILEFPAQPGAYTLRFDLVAEGVGVFLAAQPDAVVELEAQVR